MKIKSTWRITEWMKETFGERWCLDNDEGTWTFFWDGQSYLYRIQFEHPEDAAVFLLKYS